jgi:hypothetical protein
MFNLPQFLVFIPRYNKKLSILFPLATQSHTKRPISANATFPAAIAVVPVLFPCTNAHTFSHGFLVERWRVGCVVL